ncbi:MAG: DUF3795 domain-containing protein [Promethearchaeota archaeon]
MEKMIVYCGINCTNCETYIATQNDDDILRKKVQEIYKKTYKMDLKLEDINCDGCNSDGRIFFFCKSCRVRKCAKRKGYDNCAHCEEFICKKLDTMYSIMLPERRAKEALEKIRETL